MSASESFVSKSLLAAIHKVRATLFRTNSGMAYLSAMGPKGVQRRTDGSVLIMAARPIALGMTLLNNKTAPGLSDHNGWTIKTIQPDWVGREVAIYTAAEEKREKGGRVSDDQRNWLAQVRAAGGIALVVNNVDEAVAAIRDWAPPAAPEKVPRQAKLE